MRGSACVDDRVLPWTAVQKLGRTPFNFVNVPLCYAVLVTAFRTRAARVHIRPKTGIEVTDRERRKSILGNRLAAMWPECDPCAPRQSG